MSTVYKYFKDMGKFPLLTKEEELECSIRASDILEKLIDELLDLPCTWSAIINHRERITQEKKSPNKMAEDYGDPALSLIEINRRVDGNIVLAIENIFAWTNRPSILLHNTIKERFKSANLSQHVYLTILETLVKFRDEGDVTTFYEVTGHWKPELDRRLLSLTKLRDELKECRHRIIQSNLRLVIHLARRYQGLGVPLADLIQEGNIGLMRAAEKFRYQKEMRFSTYAAFWIKQSFLKAIKNSSKTVRLPSHVHDVVSRTSRVREELYQKLKREPSIVELANATETSVEQLECLLDLMNEPIPLETPVHSGDSKSRKGTLKDFIAVDMEDPVDAIDRERLAEDINRTLADILSPRECTVISMRYGLAGQEEHTLQEIAAKLEKSRERIRQIESAAMKKLKESDSLKEHLR
jgi:RNA polymerase primary sigma factor